MKNALVCMALVLLAPAVSAGKVYVGAGVGSSSAELDGTSSRIDFGDTGYVGFVGYRVLRNVAAELSYTDFGSLSETVDGTSFDAELSVAALWAVGILPATPNLEIYGRLGDDYDVPVLEDTLGDILTDAGLKADPIHPNARGHEVLAAELAEEIEPLLEARREMGR